MCIYELVFTIYFKKKAVVLFSVKEIALEERTSMVVLALGAKLK